MIIPIRKGRWFLLPGYAFAIGISFVVPKLYTVIANQGCTGSIMTGADPKAGAIVFSLPVTDTAGLRLIDED